MHVDNLCQTRSDGYLRHMVRHSEPYSWHTGIKLCLQVVEESVTPGVAKQCHDKMVLQNRLKQVSYRRTHTTYGTSHDCLIALHCWLPLSMSFRSGGLLSAARIQTTNVSYRMRLKFCGTKLSRIANLLNIRGFYFRGCWERINMVDHLIPGKLRN